MEQQGPTGYFRWFLAGSLDECASRAQSVNTDVSPQYHVIFDDEFSTIPALTSLVERDETFEKLFESSRERFVDEEDLTHLPDLELNDDGLPVEGSDLLEDQWLTQGLVQRLLTIIRFQRESRIQRELLLHAWFQRECNCPHLPPLDPKERQRKRIGKMARLPPDKAAD